MPSPTNALRVRINARSHGSEETILLYETTLSGRRSAQAEGSRTHILVVDNDPLSFSFMRLRFNSLRRLRRRCIRVAGDELGALTHDFRQNRFPISVDRCHLDQINQASPRVSCVVRFSPSRPEFIRPLPDQLTLQRPPLFIEQVCYRDLRHDSTLTDARDRIHSNPE